LFYIFGRSVFEMAQITQGMKGLCADGDMKEREEAFLHLEKMKRNIQLFFGDYLLNWGHYEKCKDHFCI
jgi:hypothetical protein